MLNTRPKSIKQKIKRVIIVLLSLFFMVGTLLYFFQEKLIFLPTVLPQDYNYQFNYPFEELFLHTDETTVINALHFKNKSPKGVILYFHGNAGDLSRWGTITEFFVEKEYDVLVMDYRTYGKSTGVLSEHALYRDAQYCYNYLKAHYDENEITVYGRSLGTGIASLMASKNNPKQLILETPYYSMENVVKSRFPLFSLNFLLKYKFPTYQYIKSTSCPILMIHGTDDKVIPFNSAEKLFSSSLPTSRTTFIRIDGGSHNNLIDYQEFHRIIRSVLP
jgi:pimeloyl-ACP methyl ester carboxylesterase